MREVTQATRTDVAAFHSKYYVGTAMQINTVCGILYTECRYMNKLTSISEVYLMQLLMLCLSQVCVP